MLYKDMFPWRKDANKDFMITSGFQHKILGQIIPESFLSVCLRCELILINGFCFNEKIPDGKAGTRAETAQNDITKLQFDWLFDSRGL